MSEQGEQEVLCTQREKLKTDWDPGTTGTKPQDGTIQCTFEWHETRR